MSWDREGQSHLLGYSNQYIQASQKLPFGGWKILWLNKQNRDKYLAQVQGNDLVQEPRTESSSLDS